MGTRRPGAGDAGALAAAQGAQQIEAKGEELSAMLSIIRQQVRAALDAARFRPS